MSLLFVNFLQTVQLVHALAPLAAAIAVIGAGVGIGKIGASALEAMARQPEAAGRIQSAMIIIAALIEGAALFAIVICFMALNK